VTRGCSLLHRLWGPHSLLNIGYQGLFPPEYINRGVKVIAHLLLIQKLKIVEPYLHSPIRPPGVVLD
jgi:hypothetical protein